MSYLVADPATKQAAVIDPVLDYDQRAGKASTNRPMPSSQPRPPKALTIDWVLETHAHADHLSAAPYIKLKTGAKVGDRRAHPRRAEDLPAGVQRHRLSGDGSEFDRLFEDGEHFPLGSLEVEVLHAPGHTPADIAYKIGDAVFVGDTLFMPDYGTARADFPGGDARTLYRSIQRLLALPPDTRLFMCHDYKAPGRDHYAWETTVAEQRARTSTSGRRQRGRLRRHARGARRQARRRRCC